MDALTATSAAPTYFRRQDIDKKAYADGGLGANCPVAKGLQLAQYYWNQHLVDDANYIFHKSVQLRKTEFALSLGTGATKAKEYDGMF